MPNLDKAARQHVWQKAPHKFEGRKYYYFLFVAVGRIAPAKGDLAVFEAQDSPVGAGKPPLASTEGPAQKAGNWPRNCAASTPTGRKKRQ
jgi:hypothetical protein